jgi:hypothetical protein
MHALVELFGSFAAEDRSKETLHQWMAAILKF